MNLESQNNERQIVQHAIEWYLSELRQEIAKTDKYDMRMGLHHEEDILNNFVTQMRSSEEVCISQN